MVLKNGYPVMELGTDYVLSIDRNISLDDGRID